MLILIGAVALGLVGVAQVKQQHILLLEVDGMINPATEGFIARGVRRAEENGSMLIVIQLDTPGGLLDSTRKITQHLLNASVPSVVFVAPRGARAASAGTFITAAATFAVMAPGTNIGAASPVAGSGEDLPETLKSKATNAAAAEIRSIAALRGRNEERLNATVLKALSFTAEEAVESNIVDFIANDLDDLLAQLHWPRPGPPPSARLMTGPPRSRSGRVLSLEKGCRRPRSRRRASPARLAMDSRRSTLWSTPLTA